MPKATDITGTFRIPEEAWGRFWNTMLALPGAEITPNVKANGSKEPTAKRTNGKAAEGSTGKCIVLAALTKHRALGVDALGAFMVTNGKAASSLNNLLHGMKKAKEITKTASGYAITAKGRKYLQTSCPVAALKDS